ncbi:MAG: 30S ribosomal protein S6 [Candidatus Gastranaerophilales bacterium]|nr:30S ribosomal protein S6 [Candidatus Gastranaerophilales bacterium]
MKKYDLFTIIKPNLDNEEADKVVAKVEEIIASLGGSVIDTDKMGRKKLAYEVAGFTDGFMVNQVVSVPADKIVELKRQLKLNDSVIRVMFTVKECA